MDGEMYFKWVKERLVPTFERKYPNKKMILVIDNARFHKPRVSGVHRPSWTIFHLVLCGSILAS